MLAKLASIKRIAGELSAKYVAHGGDGSAGDPAFGALRERLAALAACYATLDELALDYATKMEAAVRAAATFGAALRAAAGDVAAALPPKMDRLSGESRSRDAHRGRGRSGGAAFGTGTQADMGMSMLGTSSSSFCSSRPSPAGELAEDGLTQLMCVAAEMLENLDATGELRTMLTNYRAFLSVFTEVTLLPFIQLDIPRVEKLRFSAEQAHKRAKNAEVRTTSPPVPQPPLQGSARPSSLTSSSSSVALPSSGTVHRQTAPMRQPSVSTLHHSAKIEHDAYENELAKLLDKAGESCAHHRTHQVQRLAGLCRHVNETLCHVSVNSRARCAQAVQQVPGAAASLIPAGPASSRGLHQHESHPMTVYRSDLPSTHEWPLTRASSDPLVDFRPGCFRDMLPFDEPEINEIVPADVGTVDWIELWAELKFLVDMRQSDDEVRRIYSSCTLVEPAILPNVELRYLTLEAPADSAVEVQSLDTPAEHYPNFSDPSVPVRARSEPAMLKTSNSFVQSRVQYIVAKGTNFKNLKHIVLDLSSTLIFDRELGIHFHSGFYKAGCELYHHVKPKLKKDIPIKIVGHSMGGAAACICAMLLQKDGYIFESMHTFGAPRFTDHAGADAFRNLFGTLLLRVCHYHDIVRTRPAPSRFRHVGRLVVFHEDDAVWYLPESPTLEPAQNASFSKGFNSHRTSTYADCVRRQLERILGPETGERSGYVRSISDEPSNDDPMGDP